MMEIRKVQKTGDMHYIYLPTNWCKKHKISSNSKLNIEQDSSGRLILCQIEGVKKKDNKINIAVSESDEDIIHKLIMACYVNPLNSFKITLEKEINYTKLLNQKKIISLESVEIDKNVISSDSSVILTDPDLLLITMVKKIKNLLLVMIRDYDKELIARYEEEIDRSKMLIEKSIISYLTLNLPLKLKTIELYYISLISRDLERIVDHMIRLEQNDVDYLEQAVSSIDILREIMETLNAGKDRFDYKKALELVKEVNRIKQVQIKDVKHYDKRRIKGLLSNVAEIVLDWAITSEIEKSY
jgi:phosphate uptake regulator